jgi:hypothetical protein
MIDNIDEELFGDQKMWIGLDQLICGRKISVLIFKFTKQKNTKSKIHFGFYQHCHFVQCGSTICFVVLLIGFVETLVRSKKKTVLLRAADKKLKL